MLPIASAQGQQHSLGSNEWMYWELNVTQDASTVLVQLNRTAGDPVLFLKPAQAGFQVRQALPCPELLTMHEHRAGLLAWDASQRKAQCRGFGSAQCLGSAPAQASLEL